MPQNPKLISSRPMPFCRWLKSSLALVGASFGTLSVAFIASLPGILYAAEPHSPPPNGLSTEDYGSLYVIEQREKDVSRWRTGLTYAHEFSNPYLNIDGLSLSAQHSLNRYALVGLQVTGYHSSSTRLMDAVGEQLRVHSNGLEAERPIASGYATVGLIPLAGHLNFFGNRPLEFEFQFLLGGGGVEYTKETVAALGWWLKPTLVVTRNWSIEGSIGQELESPFSGSSLTRLEGGAGISYRF